MTPMPDNGMGGEDREARLLTPARRALLIRLERIIARNVVNVNAHRHAGGARNHRYPILCVDGNGKAVKVTGSIDIPGSVPTEHLIRSSYHFGANHLQVMEALKEIVEYLEDNCGVQVDA